MEDMNSKSPSKKRHTMDLNKDYQKIVEKSPLLNGPIKPEWKTIGDTFIKFSIYDENLRSIASTETSYCF